MTLDVRSEFAGPARWAKGQEAADARAVAVRRRREGRRCRLVRRRHRQWPGLRLQRAGRRSLLPGVRRLARRWLRGRRQLRHRAPSTSPSGAGDRAFQRSHLSGDHRSGRDHARAPAQLHSGGRRRPAGLLQRRPGRGRGPSFASAPRRSWSRTSPGSRWTWTPSSPWRGPLHPRGRGLRPGPRGDLQREAGGHAWEPSRPFSTMSGKHHATGAQGGVVFTRDEARYWTARRASDRGKPFGLQGAGGTVLASLNLNLNDLAATIGRVQLKKLAGIVAAAASGWRRAIDAGLAALAPGSSRPAGRRRALSRPTGSCACTSTPPG